MHGRHHSFPRNYPSYTPIAHMTGASAECFSAGRVLVPSKVDGDQLASSENAVRHASEAGLGPVQNQSGMAPGSSIDRQAGYYRCAGHPSAPMGNSTPQGHNRILQFQNATTQSTGHDRTGVGGGRNNNIYAGDRLGGIPLPAEQPLVQPICERGEFAAHSR